MSGLDRSYWLAVAVIAYLGVASLQGAGANWVTMLAIGAGPLVLAWVWQRTRHAPRTADVATMAPKALRACAAAAVVWLLSRLGAPQHPGLELAAAISCGVCAVSGTYSLARIPARPGLIQPPKSALSIDAAAFSGFLWSLTATVAAARVLVPPSTLPLDPLSLDYANTAASIGSLLVLIAAAWRVRVVRKLELGVADRASGALALVTTALSVAVPVAAVDLAAPDRALPAAVIVGSLCAVWTVMVPDATRVSSTLRGTLAVMMLGVPAALLSGVFAARAPDYAGPIALLGCAATLLVGLIAREIAEPLGPEQSRWLKAISEATQNALVPEPKAALVATLQALKKTSTSPKVRPELWRVDPPSVLSVDVAGYLDERDAEVPSRIVELGVNEPERTLRVDTLAALQIRRPEVRDLLAWFEVREAFSATIVVDDDGAHGFLLLPRGGRSSTLSLEEARSIRGLADRLSALLSMTASLSRARKREQASREQAEHFEAEFERMKVVVEGEAERHRGFAENLARPLTQSAYSAATRAALTQLEHYASNKDAMLLVAPLGVAPEPWGAAAHLSGPNRDGPLVFVNGTDREADAAADESWLASPRSPLNLAQGGTLLIKDVHLLPQVRQLEVLQGLTQSREMPRGLALPRLILTMPDTPGDAAGSLKLAPAVEQWVGASRLQLPTLSDRAEDLRSLVLAALSHSPLSADGTPLGIERRALQLLLDYPWPGNDAELRDVVGRAALACASARIDVADLKAIGFPGLTEHEEGPLADSASGPLSEIPAPPNSPTRTGFPPRGGESVAPRGAPSEPPPDAPIRRRSRAPRNRRRH